MLRKTIDSAECEVEIDWYLQGSVLQGTVSSGARACRTRLHIDSPEPDEVIDRIIRLAKQGCFAEQMVQAAVPLTSTYVVNGTERDISPPPD
jgi:small ligand-binding sensory domain FIST